MDLTTLMLIAGLFTGALIGDVAIFGRTFRINGSVPPAIAQQGVTSDGVQELFVAEMERLDRVGTVLPLPKLEIASRPSLLTTTGKLANLDPIIELAQMQLGIETTTINAMVVLAPALPNLQLYVTVLRQRQPDQRIVETRSDGDVSALIRQGARSAAVLIAPYRAALVDFVEGQFDDRALVARARQTAETALSRPIEPVAGAQRMLMHNLLGLIALLDGDRARTEQALDAAMAVPNVPERAQSLIAANRMTLALADRRLDEARRWSQDIHHMMFFLPPSKLHMEVLMALLPWAEGDLEEAERRLLAAAADTPANVDVHTYLARLYEQQGRHEDAAAQQAIARESRDTAIEVPALITSSFWIDPVKGGMTRRR